MLSRLVCRRNRGANVSKKAASSGSASGEALGTLFIFMLHSTTETNKVVLAVIVRCFLERLPLLDVVPKDDQGHLLALNQIKQLAHVGAEDLLIVVAWTRFAIREKPPLQGYRIDSEQYRTRFVETHQARFMSGRMPAR